MTIQFKELSAFFGKVSKSTDSHINESLDKAGKIIRDEAKRVIGTYDYDWPKLKEETIKRKLTGDSPLLETGELRASIESHLDAGAKRVYIGSNNPKARYHELGTSRIPPRSFLMGAAVAKYKVLQQMFGGRLQMLVMGKDPGTWHGE
jgi:HK97 gp10 family phage protein